MIKDEILFAQDRTTIMVVLSVFIAFVIYKAVKFIVKYRKYKRYQIRLAQKQRLLAEQKARQKAVNNFFYNRIEEDIKYIFIKERKWKNMEYIYSKDILDSIEEYYEEDYEN